MRKQWVRLLGLIYGFLCFFVKYLFIFVVVKMLVVLVRPIIIVCDILVFLSFVFAEMRCLYAFQCYFDACGMALCYNIPLLCYCKTIVLCLSFLLCALSIGFFKFLCYLYDLAMYLYIPSLCYCTIANLCILVINFC